MDILLLRSVLGKVGKLQFAMATHCLTLHGVEMVCADYVKAACTDGEGLDDTFAPP